MPCLKTEASLDAVVAKTHEMQYLCRSFSAKEPCNYRAAKTQQMPCSKEEASRDIASHLIPSNLQKEEDNLRKEEADLHKEEVTTLRKEVTTLRKEVTNLRKDKASYGVAMISRLL